MFGIVNFYYRQVYCFYLTSEEREVDFESSASANFTTPASVLFYHASGNRRFKEKLFHYRNITPDLF